MSPEEVERKVRRLEERVQIIEEGIKRAQAAVVRVQNLNIPYTGKVPAAGMIDPNSLPPDPILE